MNIPYEKDNKERIPFTHYLEEFQALDPETASLRSGIPYDKDKKEFALRMLGKEFLISWPEFEVRRADETDTQYAAILEGVPAKIMAIRMIANGIAAAPTVSILPIVRCPGEPFIFSSLLDDASADWRFPMAIVWQTFVQLWNGWEQKTAHGRCFL